MRDAAKICTFNGQVSLAADIEKAISEMTEYGDIPDTPEQRKLVQETQATFADTLGYKWVVVEDENTSNGL